MLQQPLDLRCLLDQVEGRVDLANLCKGVCRKQFQAAVILEEEAVVDAFCTHCQYMSWDQGEGLASPLDLGYWDP